MTILTKPKLLRLIEDGVIENTLPEHVEGSCIAVHLANEFKMEVEGSNPTHFNISNRLTFVEYTLKKPDARFMVPPGRFFMGMTKEVFHVPNTLTGFFFLRSRIARNAVNHSQSIMLKPGWNGHLALEFTNNSAFAYLPVSQGVEVGSVVFFEHEATEPHDGRYSNQFMLTT